MIFKSKTSILFKPSRLFAMMSLSVLGLSSVMPSFSAEEVPLFSFHIDFGDEGLQEYSLPTSHRGKKALSCLRSILGASYEQPNRKVFTGISPQEYLATEEKEFVSPMDAEVMAYLMSKVQGKVVFEIGAADGLISLLFVLAGAEKVYMSEINHTEMTAHLPYRDELPSPLADKSIYIPKDFFRLEEEHSHLFGTVDLVVCRHFLHLVQEPQQDLFFGLIKKLLKPSGQLYMTQDAIYPYFKHIPASFNLSLSDVSDHNRFYYFVVQTTLEDPKKYAYLWKFQEELTDPSMKEDVGAESHSDTKFAQMMKYLKQFYFPQNYADDLEKVISEDDRVSMKNYDVNISMIQSYSAESLGKTLRKHGFNVSSSFGIDSVGHVVLDNSVSGLMNDASQTGVLAQQSPESVRKMKAEAEKKARQEAETRKKEAALKEKQLAAEKMKADKMLAELLMGEEKKTTATRNKQAQQQKTAQKKKAVQEKAAQVKKLAAEEAARQEKAKKVAEAAEKRKQQKEALEARREQEKKVALAAEKKKLEQQQAAAAEKEKRQKAAAEKAAFEKKQREDALAVYTAQAQIFATEKAALEKKQREEALAVQKAQAQKAAAVTTALEKMLGEETLATQKAQAQKAAPEKSVQVKRQRQQALGANKSQAQKVANEKPVQPKVVKILQRKNTEQEAAVQTQQEPIVRKQGDEAQYPLFGNPLPTLPQPVSPVVYVPIAQEVFIPVDSTPGRVDDSGLLVPHTKVFHSTGEKIEKVITQRAEEGPVYVHVYHREGENSQKQREELERKNKRLSMHLLNLGEEDFLKALEKEFGDSAQQTPQSDTQ